MNLKPYHRCPKQYASGSVISYLGLFILLLSIAGCNNASKYASLDSQAMPKKFELTISSYFTAGKHTYMTLDQDGLLSYAGGKAAIFRETKPIITLTHAQRQKVWSLIVDSKMLNTKNQLFKSPKEVAYDVEIDLGKSFSSKSFHVTDQSIPPAVVQLHDMLFNLQADEQYKPQLPRSQKK